MHVCRRRGVYHGGWGGFLGRWRIYCSGGLAVGGATQRRALNWMMAELARPGGGGSRQSCVCARQAHKLHSFTSAPSRRPDSRLHLHLHLHLHLSMGMGTSMTTTTTKLHPHQRAEGREQSITPATTSSGWRSSPPPPGFSALSSRRAGGREACHDLPNSRGAAGAQRPAFPVCAPPIVRDLARQSAAACTQLMSCRSKTTALHRLQRRFIGC